MTSDRPSRKKYVLLKLQVWPANRAYVTAVADALDVPINEAARRILTDAESRRLFLPKNGRSESLTEGK